MAERELQSSTVHKVHWLHCKIIGRLQNMIISAVIPRFRLEDKPPVVLPTWELGIGISASLGNSGVFVHFHYFFLITTLCCDNLCWPCSCWKDLHLVSVCWFPRVTSAMNSLSSCLPVSYIPMDWIWKRISCDLMYHFHDPSEFNQKLLVVLNTSERTVVLRWGSSLSFKHILNRHSYYFFL